MALIPLKIPKCMPKKYWENIMEDIDPVKYGAMYQKVQDLDRKIDKMERQVEELLAMANKSKGGMFFGMAVVSFIGGIAGFIMHWMTVKWHGELEYSYSSPL